jgi:hypothetical protein
MNEERRKTLKEAIGLIDQAKNILEDAQTDEQEAFDNMPEGMQNGEKGEKVQGAIDSMGEAIASCDDIVGQIEAASE